MLKQTFKSAFYLPTLMMAESSIKIVIRVAGPIRINRVLELDLQDGGIVRQFRSDVYGPAEWGI